MIESSRIAGGSANSIRDSGETVVVDTRLLHLRLANLRDLDAVNALIEGAINTWDLPDRVKRLAVPLYRYHEQDSGHLEMVVAEAEGIGIVGMAAWEQADPGDAPAGQSALLLHGIYVAPDQHRNGVGTHLFQAAEKAAASRGFDGVLVRVQPDAVQFFLACGLVRLAVSDHRRDYAHRFWKSSKCP